MKIKEFAEIIRTELESTGRDVKVHEVPKSNNVVLHGISIRRPGRSIALTVYIEHYFEDYQNGSRIDSIVAAILKVVQDGKMDKPMDMNVVQKRNV